MLFLYLLCRYPLQRLWTTPHRFHHRLLQPQLNTEPNSLIPYLILLHLKQTLTILPRFRRSQVILQMILSLHQLILPYLVMLFLLCRRHRLQRLWTTSLRFHHRLLQPQLNTAPNSLIPHLILLHLNPLLDLVRVPPLVHPHPAPTWLLLDSSIVNRLAHPLLLWEKKRSHFLPYPNPQFSLPLPR